MEEESGFFEGFVDGVLDIIYSPKKRYVRMLILLVCAGFLLRLVASVNLNVLADDMVFASQSAGILNAGILSTHSNPPLFFYLTDLAYKFFGYTTFSSRLLPLIAGTFLIIVIFLITRKLFNEKIALMSAFFVTFSSFLIRMTFSEQSLLIFFFVFFGTYLGMVYLDNKKLRYLIFSGVLFGLGFLTKYNSPFFIVSFIVFSAYYSRRRGEIIFSKRNIKHFILFLCIIFIFVIPVLSFNYLIYKEMGIVDVYFSRVIGVEKAQELYAGLGGQERSFFDNLLIWSNYGNYKLVYKTDPVILLFSVLGLGLFIRKKRNIALFFFLSFLIIPFVLQSAGAPLQKHFAFMPFLFSIPAGYGLNWTMDRFGSVKSVRWAIIIVLLALMFVSLGIAHGTPGNYFSKSDTSQLKEFLNDNVRKDDLVIFDSRIYTAQTFWLATDNHFLTLQQFPEFYKYNQELGEELISLTNIYFVECVIDDCGWGWVSDNQEFNQTSESLLNGIREQGEVVKRINSYDYSGNELYGDKINSEKYAVYRVKAELSPLLIGQADLINSFYFAPYLYKNMESYVYNYDRNGLNGLVHNISLWIIYLAMLLTFISFVIVLRFV